MILLFFVFFYVGLFTIGGGMVAIPLILQQVVHTHHWLSEADFYSMVAIAQSTPGPVGINVATYVGYEMFGVVGSLIATIGFVTPSFVIVSFLAGLLRKYRNAPLVQNWFLYIKAAIIGLIGYTLVAMTLKIIFHNDGQMFVDYKDILFLVALSVIFYFLRKKPWIVIIIGGILGMIFL
ncbi:MAG: chromate transporter [Candidatus Izemoplasmatales bacterium]